MHLAEFLALHRVDPAVVNETLFQVTPERASDALYLSGSLIEGLGNLRSDLDAYWITDAEAATTFGQVMIRHMGSFAVDIELVRPAALEMLLDRLEALSRSDEPDPRRWAVAFSLGELKLLHNLRIGRPLREAGIFDRLVRRVDSQTLSRVLFEFARVHLDMLHADIAGALETGDDGTARQLLRAYRSHLAACLLAALGETNPAEKWRSRKLAAVRAAHGKFVLPRGQLVESIVDALASMDEKIGTGEPIGLFRELLHLSYAIVPWGAARFLGDVQSCAKGPAPIVLATDGPDRQPLPRLRIDCCVGRDRRGIWVSSRQSPHVLYLNPLALDLLLCFDGHTTRHQAQHMLSQHTSAESAELFQSIDDFTSVLAARELT